MIATSKIVFPPPGAAGVKMDMASIHNAGPAKAIPCESFLTVVTDHPLAARPSATGPTNGVMNVIAMYGINVRRELFSTLSPRAISKYDGSHAKRV
eukprot:CAMPEP_0118803674 /NCGR_PEP_ID=MMETSP1161-20130426/18610_1 /TAXON_ID=249345 /ORGANISM="Picochlorum oklahomensis, Strain CCMP2329" /LENGTH=95 /DNA_ID=CAMNT_0006732239 /DNA_START=317 /DNA_END=604 /DNA_ORIENTATION=-